MRVGGVAAGPGARALLPTSPFHLFAFKVAALCLPLLLTPTTASAQSQSATPGAAPANSTAQALDAALARLARNPRDIDSLVAAGRAALALGDTDAAVGFFSRADRLAPATPRVLAGLAVAKVRARDPLAALPLFDMADAGGALTPDDMADRGLAFDLVGDNRSAQNHYRRALASGTGAFSGGGGESARRLVLSRAIAGDRAGVETALRPLLESGDRAATRTQAFALAILGREDEAVAVVRATMPPELATAISPYLRYMRKLTPAQQAAAANLGEFPHAADIGVDDPRIAQYAAEHHLRPAGPELALAPTGDATRAKPRGADRTHRKPAPVAANPAPPELPQGYGPSREEAPSAPPAAADASSVKMPVYTQAPPAAPPYGPVENEPHPADNTGAPAQSAVPAEPVGPGPSVSVPVVQAVPPAAPAPSAASGSAALGSASPAPKSPATASPAAARRRINFADAFATMGENAPVFEPAPGAVDIRKIAPSRAEAKPVPKAAPKPPPPPAHPSRIWVELGVGRDTDRLAFDWHRMTRDEPELFARRKPFVTGWVRTNRLLTGPFDTQEAAETFAQQMRKAGHDGVFVWTSPAGQVVDPLDAR